jgi:hypothetical protein
VSNLITVLADRGREAREAVLNREDAKAAKTAPRGVKRPPLRLLRVLRIFAVQTSQSRSGKSRFT